jgi:hypothetical protein
VESDGSGIAVSAARAARLRAGSSRGSSSENLVDPPRSPFHYTPVSEPSDIPDPKLPRHHEVDPSSLVPILKTGSISKPQTKFRFPGFASTKYKNEIRDTPPNSPRPGMGQRKVSFARLPTINDEDLRGTTPSTASGEISNMLRKTDTTMEHSSNTDVKLLGEGVAATAALSPVLDRFLHGAAASAEEKGAVKGMGNELDRLEEHLQRGGHHREHANGNTDRPKRPTGRRPRRAKAGAASRAGRATPSRGGAASAAGRGTPGRGSAKSGAGHDGPTENRPEEQEAQRTVNRHAAPAGGPHDSDGDSSDHESDEYNSDWEEHQDQLAAIGQFRGGIRPRPDKKGPVGSPGGPGGADKPSGGEGGRGGGPGGGGVPPGAMNNRPTVNGNAAPGGGPHDSDSDSSKHESDEHKSDWEAHQDQLAAIGQFRGQGIRPHPDKKAPPGSPNRPGASDKPAGGGVEGGGGGGPGNPNVHPHQSIIGRPTRQGIPVKKPVKVKRPPKKLRSTKPWNSFNIGATAVGVVIAGGAIIPGTIAAEKGAEAAQKGADASQLSAQAGMKGANAAQLSAEAGIESAHASTIIAEANIKIGNGVKEGADGTQLIAAVNYQTAAHNGTNVAAAKAMAQHADKVNAKRKRSYPPVIMYTSW